MAGVLGRLLTNRRAGEVRSAWRRPNLLGPDPLVVSSEDVADGGPIPVVHTARPAGGDDVSPHLTWSEPPPGTTQLLLVVEDYDVPLRTPAVHCLALVAADGAAGSARRLAPGDLAAGRDPAGVTVLRSTIGRGYHGPAPIKGHGPHRYAFQLFALGGALDGGALTRTGPRRVLGSITVPVLARGRLIGTFER